MYGDGLKNLILAVAFPIFLISDGTGNSVQTLVTSLMIQFSQIEVEKLFFPFVRTDEDVMKVITAIDIAKKKHGVAPIIFTTTLSQKTQQSLESTDCQVLNLLQPFSEKLSQILKIQPERNIGLQHEISSQENYLNRIDAMDFTLKYDDGQLGAGYDKAHIILIGPSRSGKTPTSMYIALNYALFIANYPLTPDDLVGDKFILPEVIRYSKKKIYGLVINPDILAKHRKNRRETGVYSTIQQCEKEVNAAYKLYEEENIPFIDSTNCAIEEIAARVVLQFNFKK